MASTRLFLGLLATSLVAGVPAFTAPALAQSPADQATQLNDQGKLLIRSRDYAGASAKFRQAIALSPEGRFYLNFCMSLYQEGKLGEALVACRSVGPRGGSSDQVTQANNIVETHIVPQMRAAGIDPDAPPTPDGTGDGTGTTGDGTGTTGDGTGTTGDGTGTTGDGTGTTGDGTGTTANPTASNFTVAPPPSLFDQTAAKPTHEYTWTLGAQLLFLGTKEGYEGDYSTSATGFRLVGDYALSAAKKVGAQGYITYYPLSGDGLDGIDVLDLGLAAYKEVCAKRMCLKPLIGLQIGSVGEGTTNAFGRLGVRAELGFEYAIGQRFENVVTVGLGADFYSAAQSSDTDTTDPAAFGLDQSGRNVYLGVGFTRRFNSPLGSSPLFTLQ